MMRYMSRIAGLKERRKKGRKARRKKERERDKKKEGSGKQRRKSEEAHEGAEKVWFYDGRWWILLHCAPPEEA